MTTKQSLTLKLSAAQVIALADSMSNEQKILLRSIERLSNATLKLTNRYAKKVATAMSLVELALVDLSSEANPIKKSVFAMNDLGWAVWHYIVNGTLPETDAAQVTETAENAPVIAETPVDELPAKMLREAELMDADTNPPTEYTVGQTVKFHYALSNVDGQLYTGIVKGSVKYTELWGDVVLIEPTVNDYHLPPRHVSVSRIVAIVAAAPVIEAAPVEDILVTQANISAAYMAWETAWLANPKSELTAKLSAEHDRLLDAYMMSIGAKNALPASDTGVSSAPIASQVLPITDDAKEPEMAVERVLEGSRKTGVVASFNPSKGYGYIQTDAGETLYFQAQNLKVPGMPINARDRVTFHVMPNFSIEGGMDKATRVMVEGYTPAPRPAYQPSAELVADAKTADMPRKQAARQQRTFKQAQAEKNAASLKRVMGGGA